LPRFDRILIADWSASGTPSPARPSSNAIWLGQTDSTGTQTSYHRSRATAEAALSQAITRAKASGESLLIGFDFPMAYPQGFATALVGQPDPAAVWAHLAAEITDEAQKNNRFEVAAAINARLGPLFWGRPATLNLAALPATKTGDYTNGIAERRHVETLVPRAQPVWKLYTTGAAGSQGLIGQPMIHRLAARAAVWPFQPPAQITLAEVYPSLLARAVKADPAPIKDEAQVRLLSRALYTLSQQGKLAPLFNTPAIAREEGWILGAGHETSLEAAL
jgi:molybdopterin-guanine dinucleotide biosynthesis adapter protein